jgi:hypothetical protein
MIDIKILTADLELIVKDSNGKEIEHREGESHSWVKNFYHFILTQVSGVYTTTTTYATAPIDIDGVTTNSIISRAMRGYESASSAAGLWSYGTDSRLGCRVGTGSGATIESFTDYKLDGACPSGTAVNTFVVSVGTSVYSTASAGTVLKCKHDRTFTNNSGGNIAVTESGLYGQFWMTAGGDTTCMINRDTFGAINVANGNTLYVAYTIKLTLPQAIHL